MSTAAKFLQEDTKRAAIESAAIAEFSARGFAATSMANIASAAGMSRPALYQYFRNKNDIFVSAFTALFNATTDRALAALSEPGSVAEQLDGFLQRFEGDLWEYTAASPHSEELMSAKYEFAAEPVLSVIARLLAGLSDYLDRVDPRRSSAPARARREEWLEVLQLSPKGFKIDEPTVTTYRRRLTTLSRSVAADIESE